MVPVPEGKEWFTVPQVARILDVHVQSVYDAVKKGRMEARGTGRERRIHAREVLGYAARTGRNADAVARRIQDVAGEIDWQTLAAWALAGIGLYLVLKNLKD